MRDMVLLCHRIPAQDGSPLLFRAEARDGTCILACTAAAYCRLLKHYNIKGTTRGSDEKWRMAAFGNHPVPRPSAPIATTSTTPSFATGRDSSQSKWNEELLKAVDGALEKVATELK